MKKTKLSTNMPSTVSAKTAVVEHNGKVVVGTLEWKTSFWEFSPWDMQPDRIPADAWTIALKP